jgi:hypothetical protein
MVVGEGKGLKIRTAAQAAEASSAFRRQPGREFQVGDRLKEPPCKPVAELADPRMAWQREGRACPRVVLPPSLHHEATVMLMLHDGSPNLQAFLSLFPRGRRRRLWRTAQGALAMPSVEAYTDSVKRAREKVRQDQQAQAAAAMAKRARG